MLNLKYDIPVNQVKLVCRGKNLDDHYSMGAYSIHTMENPVIYVVKLAIFQKQKSLKLQSNAHLKCFRL